MTIKDDRKFMAKVLVDSDGCWIWQGSIGNTGYGQVRRTRPSNKLWLTHRYSYTQEYGTIPDGLCLDHLCRVRACCNPEHLEPVTHAENMRRAPNYRHNVRKTHCPRGHEYSGDNLYVWHGRRFCRECNKMFVRRREDRKKEAKRAAEHSSQPR